MARTSTRINKGFTLIEISVVITLLALFAALIVPNIASEQKSREARQFFAKARNLMLEAKSRAIGDGQTRTVRLDESGGRLVVQRTDAESGDSVEDRALSLPEGITGDAFRVEKNESTSAEWDVRFYGDGKARAGGISFGTNGRIISLTVDELGIVKQIDGALPELSDESWDAGGFEQRA